MPTCQLEVVGNGPSAPTEVLRDTLLKEPAVLLAEQAGDRVLVDVDAIDRHDAVALIGAVLDTKVTPSVRNGFVSPSGAPRIRDR
ncbi:hypothetical protein [Baekduia sp. Peel2402]|uniref:hypothetical protein n=1 Tax=Baekduia sp. Peel2402 TaxID=3458296 RepID=UPI00403E4BD0